jgi:hypothetical protein
MSNLVAEELSESLKSQGVTLAEDVFEARVSNIVSMISKTIDEGAEEDEKDEKNVTEEDEEDELVEGANVDEILMATSDITLGDTSVAAGEFVEIDEIDAESGTVVITVYDEDGEVKADGVEITSSDLNTLEDNSEEVEVDEEAQTIYTVSEGIHIKGGKKVKVSAAVEKLKAKLKAKKGNGVNKFTIQNGKIVKKSADQIKADKKKSKKFAKQMKRFAKKRVKSLKKSNKINSGADSGSAKVTEGFDIKSEGMTFAVEAGDVISYKDGKISIVREGTTILSGLAVDGDFIGKCIAESVAEACDSEDDDNENPDESGSECGSGKDDKDDDGVKEGAILTYRSNKGYCLVREGAEIPLGNRIRARGALKNEGLLVTSEQLDRAVNGEEVIL